ncbi:uncharacterized protein EAE97_010172 [Botrytis byssoidea]|uniref:Carbohydrate esterase family 16 protein n=1 Tax=Botrytis byssoidea TaxID=139641 RepID=A0A9P5HY04_9HELO|nr:uncharacterized protein EAE97_010172 [Botrytis byssoidea]KAF7926663.1 hypothetical protein EAE97_010172 [Botrytis byssoidea]
MMNRVALLALVGSTFASPIKSFTSRATADAKYLFSFGDSYSQTGFDITSTQPSATNPFGNPAFPGYTSDNGINWIGHLVETYNSSLILSYNFAYGGAVVDANIVAPYENTVLTLVNQTAEFVDHLSPAPTDAPWTADNSLFAFWFGVNDIGNSYWLANKTNAITAIFDSYFAQVQQVYDAGGRNFLFLNCPPIDKSPMMLAYGDSVTSSEATVISAYNTELSTRVSAFEIANSGSTTYVSDTQVPFNTALDAPATYGATNATCFDADGTTCLWYNDLHPGQAIQKLVAQGVAEQMAGSFFQGGVSVSSSASGSSSVAIMAFTSSISVSSAVQTSSPTVVASLAISSAAAIVTPVSSTANMPSSSVIRALSIPVAALSSASPIVSSAAASSTAVASSGDDECEA